MSVYVYVHVRVRVNLGFKYESCVRVRVNLDFTIYNRIHAHKKSWDTLYLYCPLIGWNFYTHVRVRVILLHKKASWIASLQDRARANW